MRRYTSEELLELAAGYALGATSDEETAAVEQALPHSPTLAAEVASFRDLTVQLARSRAVRPSAATRDRLLQRVRETPQRGDAGGSDAGGGDPKVVPITAAPTAVRQDVRRRAPRTWGFVAAIAASLLLAAGLGLENLRLRRALEERGARLAQATAEAKQRERQLDDVLLAEKDLYVAQMKSADTVRGPGIQFFWNAKQQRAMLHAFRLQPAPRGRSYQLWLIADGKPVSAAVFNSEPDGHALVDDIKVPPTPNGVTQVLLTEEPAGGSPQPTTKPFIGGTLSKT
jgi:anti-sigma-K factor RskA